MNKERRNKFSIQNNQTLEDQSILQKLKINDQLYRMRDELASLNSAKDSACLMNQSLNLTKRKSKSNHSNTFCNQFINKNNMGLRKVLQDQKVKSIVRNFIIKLKRNITSGQPVEYQPFEKQQDNNILNQNGIRIPAVLDLIHSVFSIVLILILVFVYPLQIIFNNFMNEGQITTLQTISLCFYVFEMCVNFITIKTIQGRKFTTLKDIFLDYLQRKFILDLICIAVLAADTASRSEVTKFLRLFILLKSKQCLDKLEKIENILINNFYKQQYWALTKIFFVNFAFAHILAVLLMAMSKLSQNNWLVKININDSPWYQQYVWSFYWGTTIMLTVGFGDIAPSNYKQAICITMVQTFTCILLAYNINCVGNLINNIRQQDIQKNKNFKIVRRLVQQNNVTEELQSKVCNFIDESDKMKKKFGFQAEKQFVSNLPSQLKADFLKESNIKIFENLRFFSNFTQKTLLTLAEQIQVKIAHPQQIIFKSESDSKFIILRDGKVGYCTKKNGSDYNGIPIDTIKISKKDRAMVLNLNFIFQNVNQTKFQIKSLNYSMIYKISLQEFIQIIQISSLDFQSYCELRDKSKHIIDEYEVIYCGHCPTKHSKMKCPKLHFIPISQQVIFKQLVLIKNDKNVRQDSLLAQRAHLRFCPLKIRSHFKKIEQELYRGTTTKTMTKTKTVKCDDFEDQDYQQNNQVTKQATKNGRTTTHIRTTFDENRLVFKLEKNMLEKITKIMEERQAYLNQLFWDVQSDVAHNFKFYFASFNSSELNIQIKSMKNKKQEKQSKSHHFLKAIKTINAKNVHNENFI